MASRQLTLEEVFNLPPSSIQAYLQSINWESQGAERDLISTIIHYSNNGWLTDEDQELVRHPNFSATAQSPNKELILWVQDRGLEVTALMTRFDLIRQLLLEDDIAGYLIAFGHNDRGQLGLGYRDAKTTPIQVEGILEKVKAVSAGGFHTMAITRGGQLFTFGLNVYGQLGLGNNDSKNTPTPVPISKKVKAVSSGLSHTMVITEDSQLYSFGHNGSGQLGLGHNDNRNAPTLVERIPGRVKAVSTGGLYTMVIIEYDKLLAFGLNSVGQLGLGDDNNRNTPTQVPILEKVKAVSAGSSHTMLIAVG